MSAEMRGSHLIETVFSFYEQNGTEPFYVARLAVPQVPALHEEITMDADESVGGDVFMVIRVRWDYKGNRTVAWVKLWREPYSQRKAVEDAEAIITEVQAGDAAERP